MTMQRTLSQSKSHTNIEDIYVKLIPKNAPHVIYIYTDVYSNVSIYVSYIVETHPTDAMVKTTRNIYTLFTRT